MKTRFILGIVCFLFTYSIASAQGKFSVLVNNKLAMPIEGSYEIYKGDKIEIIIKEDHQNPIRPLISAILSRPEEQGQQQQQQRATKEDTLNLPVKYHKGQTRIILKIPTDNVAAQFYLIVDLNFDQRISEYIKRFIGYNQKFKFYMK